MKLLLTLLAITFGSSASFSAETSNIKLIGRGVYNKQTQEIIALACATESCSHVQFALFSRSSSGQGMNMGWLGKAIAVPTAPTEALRAKGLQVAIEFYLSTITAQRESDRQEKRSLRIRNTFSWGVMATAVGLGLALNPMTLSTAAIIAVPVIVTGVLIRAFPSPSLTRFLNQSVDLNQTSQQSLDQNGWNWSIQPKKMRCQQFQQLKDQLLRTNIFGYEAYAGGEDSKRVYKKIERLEKKGVVFNLREIL